jgi:polyvinyl alcohol dehydrogenase (cytochrome)
MPSQPSALSSRDSTGVARLLLGLALPLTMLGCSSKSASTAPDSGTTDSGTASGPDSSGPITPPPAGNLDCDASASDWTMFGQNVCNTNSQAAAGGITTANVGTLGVKWIVDFSKVYSAGSDVSATPTVSNGSVYVPDWGGNISRIDAATGNVTWTKSIGAILQSSDAGLTMPGFASRNAPLITAGKVIFGTLRGTQLASSPGASAYLVAIDQDTAALKWATLLDTHQAAVLAGSPVVDGNTLYVGVSSQEEEYMYVTLLTGKPYTCCTFRGSVVAVDVTTGKIIWKTPTISDALYYANDAGKLSGWAGNAVWSSTPVVDRKRKPLYVTTGNNYHNVPSAAEAGAAEGNYVDSMLALDMTTGAVKWARSFPAGGADVFTAEPGATGLDSDFGAGANFFTATVNGAPKDLVGAGQKSGMYWALDADTGATVWSMQVGPGGHLGGVHWGTATDGTRIYVEDNFESGQMPFPLAGMGKNAGEMVATGTWSALDVNNGNVLWQIANPALPDGGLSGVSCNGPVAVTGGVLFAGSMDAQGTMFAFDAKTGDVLWSFQSGGTVYGGPAIVGGVVYWGSGYPSSARPLGFGTSSKKLYAFGLGLAAPDAGTDAAADDGGLPADAAGQ